MRRAAIAGLTVVTIVAAAASGNTTVVLLNDNFNVTQSSADMNWQLPIRQTGALAEIPYIQSVDDTSAYHELTQRNGELQLSGDRNGGGVVALDNNFNHSGDQIISFDFLPLTSDSDARVGNASWAAVTFGQSRDNALAFISSTDGFGLLFRANGYYRPFNAGTDMGDRRYTGTPVGQHHVDIWLSNADNQPFDGTPVTVSAYLDHAATPFFTFVRQQGFTNDYVGLSMLSAVGSDGRIYYAASNFDNLQVAALPVPQPGDVNSDGRVDFSDLLILAQHYGLSSGATWAEGDFNRDHSVGFDDLLILAQNYGTALSPVPEPTSLPLLWVLAPLLRRGRSGTGWGPNLLSWRGAE